MFALTDDTSEKTMIQSVRRSGTLLLAFALLAMSEGGAKADQPQLAPDGWQLHLTTYSWASWLTGEGGVAGRSFGVEMNPIELIDHLDWDQIPIWMSYAEARHGRLSIFNDIVYARLEGSGDFATSVSRRRASLSFGADVEANVLQVTIEAGGAYEVAKWSNAAGASSTAFDLLAGARYWRQEVDLSVDATAAISLLGLTVSGNRAVARSGSVDWVDPFVGARVRHQLAPGQQITLRGDIGGFDVGSDFTWQAIGTYNWQMCTLDGLLVDGYVGYRALSVDYEQGSGLQEYNYDVIQHGPVIGVTTRF